MKIHGDKTIKRRDNMPIRGHYRDYYAELKEDFNSLCGYCGNNCDVVRRKFHVDHFVPKTLDEDRKNDYYNLVLACPKCNIHKSNKWPTKDITKPHNGKEGFVDPATDEFNEHLQRNEKGDIIFVTDVGQYMYKELKFNIRPIRLLWKVCILRNKLDKLNKYIEDNEKTIENLILFREVSNELEKILDDLYEKGETS